MYVLKIHLQKVKVLINWPFC